MHDGVLAQHSESQERVLAARVYVATRHVGGPFAGQKILLMHFKQTPPAILCTQRMQDVEQMTNCWLPSIDARVQVRILAARLIEYGSLLMVVIIVQDCEMCTCRTRFRVTLNTWPHTVLASHHLLSRDHWLQHWLTWDGMEPETSRVACQTLQ